MARARLTKALVIEEAERMLDDVGASGLTLAALAGRLGVKQPSLYKHIESMADLQRGISVRAKLELADILTRSAVGQSRGDAVVAMSNSYRTWATEHADRYLTTLAAPAHGDSEDEEASLAATRPVFAVMAGFGLDGEDAIHAVRSWRAMLHGFVTLEAAGGFGLPTDVDRSFKRLVDVLVSSWGA
ncbi:MAG: WHG domain-containing protein [Microthrixaceae bacterium]